MLKLGFDWYIKLPCEQRALRSSSKSWEEKDRSDFCSQGGYEICYCVREDTLEIFECRGSLLWIVADKLFN